jgi:ABC-type branched-subunit amino acid transport system ATPase component
MNVAMPDLTVDRVTVRFGGLVAVDDVSLHAPAGTITGLIGPNGAGKTTTFNACTGLVSASSGSVRLGEESLNHRGPATRASRGLGRTFQRMELFDSMTVKENVALGPESLFSSRHPWGQLFSPRRETRNIEERARAAMELCGIAELSRRIAGDLSTGQRRLVELARAVASPFRFLLLDEPSSGLDVHETERFGEILVAFVAETVCSTIYVLDFGRLIFYGSTAETLASDVVQAAYLGSEGTGGDHAHVAGSAHA